MLNFCDERRYSDSTGEKEKITLVAAKLLKTEIKEIKNRPESYPNSDEIKVIRIL